MPIVAAPVLVFIGIALVIGLPAGPIMALPTQVLRLQSRAPGMGVYYSWYYAGMAILPPMAGAAHDLAGSSAAPVLFAGAMMVVALACLAAFEWASRARVLAT